MTAERPVVTDPARLTARRSLLQAQLAAARGGAPGAPPRAAVAEALAECDLRLALGGQLPPADQLTLLHEAARLDGMNPKFAYHLARAYFLGGKLDAAARWLQTAVGLCPTSHRLWAHVGLLQRELNARYFGNEAFEPDALRQRAEEVEAKVADGADDFAPALAGFEPPVSRAVLEERARRTGSNGVPPPAAAPADVPPARRLTRPGTCRWTGIHDLRLEAQLHGEPTRPRLARLIPALDVCAAAAATRRGGPAGFAVLGVLWVVSGYPPASVRRVAAARCPGWAGPSKELLDAVCELAEAPRADLPARLAAAVRERRLPPLVAAVLHRNRLLNPLPEFRNFAAVRAARRLLADATPAAVADAKATELAGRLLTAVDGLVVTPAELADIPPEAASAARPAGDLAADLATLETAAADLAAADDEAFAFIRTDLDGRVAAAADAEAAGRVRADRAVAEEIVAALAAASAAGLARLDAVIQGFGAHADETPPDLPARRDTCGNRHQEGKRDRRRDGKRRRVRATAT